MHEPLAVRTSIDTLYRIGQQVHRAIAVLLYASQSPPSLASWVMSTGDIKEKEVDDARAKVTCVPPA